MYHSQLGLPKKRFLRVPAIKNKNNIIINNKATKFEFELCRIHGHHS